MNWRARLVWWRRWTGERKEGMGLSYTGIWGYHPLVASLANTREALCLVNRPGNSVSHEDTATYMDRAFALVRDSFKEVWLRGDTDFSLTTQVLEQARQIKLRIFTWTPYVESFLEMFTWIQTTRFAYRL